MDKINGQVLNLCDYQSIKVLLSDFIMYSYMLICLSSCLSVVTLSGGAFDVTGSRDETGGVFLSCLVAYWDLLNISWFIGC